MVDDTKLNQDAIKTILEYSDKVDRQDIDRLKIKSSTPSGPTGASPQGN
jgi:hypothetical protein